jgi:calcineurin-like phosphoesterase family protein
MSRVWYTSDPHFGHQKVAEIRGFKTTEEHDYAITHTWKSQVQKNDVVYVLGDISLSNYQYALDTIKELPGRKHLISGNHDIVHSMHSRGQSKSEQARWFETFDTIQTYLVRKLNGHKVLLSHFPYPDAGDGSHREGARYGQYRLPDLGLPLLHGHTHGKETIHDSQYSDDWTIIKNQFHVGWDAWGRLVSQDEVIEWLNETYIILSPEDFDRLTEA